MIGIQLSPHASAEVNPQLFAANSILQLSTIELDQAVLQELTENPALDTLEQLICQTCGKALHLGYCLQCHGLTFTASGSASTRTDTGHNERIDQSHENVDPLSFVSAPVTLAELLFSQLQLLIDEPDHAIALYIVGNLDEHGYFTIPPAEVAQALHIEVARVTAIVQELQSLEPAGIGARNLTECLHLQLEYLKTKHILAPPATHLIIGSHLTELGYHQFEQIRTKLNISRKEVEAAYLFIRHNLHPYPAYHYAAQTDQSSSPVSEAPFVPSILLHRNNSNALGYDIELIESQRYGLYLNPLYQQMKQHPHLAQTSAESDHVIQFLERARLFMGQIKRRSLLLRKIMEYVIQYQRDFLDHGSLYLHPLTQKTVAQDLGIHVSTVSRTLANKFVLLPSREIVPLQRFFSAELRVQELIRHIILGETTPLSDATIAVTLQNTHAITLSRQMVANYRSEMNLPPARQRALLQRTKGSHHEK